MPSAAFTWIVDYNGQRLEVQGFRLAHGIRADAFAKVGGQLKFFRARGSNAHSAIDHLKAEITKAREAHVIKELRQRGGLRLVS